MRRDSTLDPRSASILIDNVPSFHGTHNGGDLEFGKDGYLYVSVGDGGCHYATNRCHTGNTAPREPNTLLGKILRITRDGGIPPDNPNVGTGTSRCNSGNGSAATRCQEIFASGLRNPFRFAFDPNAAGTRFFINDVGFAKWEEVNDGRKGADYGWPLREGRCTSDSYTDCPPPPVGLTDPIHAYRHDTGCSSVTGGAFIPRGAWPTSFDNAYLYADFVCGQVFRLLPKSGGGYSVDTFATNLPSPTHFEWGPVPGGGQALYYASFDTSSPSAPPGQVRRIRFVGNVNRPPSAQFTVTPATGPAPLTVTADGAGSIDPDGDAITYLYDFGDGTAVEASADPVAQHTYAENGSYTVTLRVRDIHGAESEPATGTVTVADRAAEVRIVSPAADHRFSVDERITLRAEATGTDGQPIPGEDITWFILKHHNDHSHPFLDQTPGESVEIVAPPPEDLRSTETSYLEVRATARDSNGTTVTTVRELRPKLVRLALWSDPTGVEITANGVRVVTNQAFSSWPGYRIVLSAPASTRNGVYTFRSWSDGVKARERTIVTRDRNDTYTAQYKAVWNPF
jgi:PKD repeat protein